MDCVPLTCHFTVMTDASAPVGLGIGIALQPVYINRPPTGGSCQAAPSSGVALQTSFTVYCTGFRDPEQFEPLQYSFGYSIAGDSSGTVYTLGGAPQTPS